MGKRRGTKKQNNKETAKARQRKKQKIKHDDTEQDSNSSTNLNTQLQAKNLKDTSSRRASLRSSKAKNLIETGITNSRCSNRQKPREHFSSTHATRQQDDLTHQVPQGSQRESPSRYLKQVEPNLRYREIETGEKCVDEENTEENLLRNYRALEEMLEEEVSEKEVTLAEKSVDEDNEAHQVPQGSQRESPFRYLKQMKPNLRSRKIEKGGKCVAEENDDENFLTDKEVSLADTPISMDPFDVVAARVASLKRPTETGMTDLPKSRKHSYTTDAIQQLHDLAYQVPQSSQGEPVLRHEEIEKSRNLAAEENLGDGIAVQLPEMVGEVGEKEVPLPEKSISRVRSLTSSLGLTKFVNMVVDEADEVDSERCAMDTVKAESMSILRKIQDRHGDIVKNCTASRMLRSTYLQTICDIISRLEGKNLSQIKEDFLLHSIASVDLIKNMEVDVEWLRIFLVDMLEAKKHLGGNFGVLKEKKESNKESIEDAESKLMECQEQKSELSAKLMEVSDLLKSKCDEEIVCKEALAKAKDESTKIAQTIKCAISKTKRFLDRSPVDDLL